MSKGERIAALSAMGVDAEGLLAKVAELKRVHTVEKHEDPKDPAKVTGKIVPDSDHLLALVQKVVTSADVAPIEAWLEKELVELS